MDLIIDIGGTKTKFMLVDDHNNVVKEEIFPSADGFLKQLDNYLTGFSDITDIGKIYYSVAGQVKKGRVIKSPNLPELTDYDLISHTQRVLNKKIKVIVANDANCFAKGAYDLLSLDDALLLGVVWGTGIGSGIVVKGKVLEGSNGMAGELGHVKLNHPYKCGCGKQGCLEAAIGGKSLESRLGKEVKSLMAESWELFERETISWLSQGLEKAVHLLDPDVVVFGGSIGENLNEPYFNKLKKLMSESLSFDSKVRFAKVNTFNAVIQGCKNYINI